MGESRSPYGAHCLFPASAIPTHTSRPLPTGQQGSAEASTRDSPFSSVPLLFLSATPAAPFATRLPDSSIRTVFLLPRSPPSRKLIRTMAPSFYSLFPGNIPRILCTVVAGLSIPLAHVRERHYGGTCTPALPYRQSSVISRR